MPAEVAVAICSLLGTLAGSLGGVLVSIRLVNYRIEQLEKKVDKLGNLMERVALTEREDKAQWKKLDQIEERIGKLEMAEHSI